MSRVRQIDLLVQEGFYPNRTDLIRTAIRNQLAAHADELKRSVARRTLSLGLQQFSRADLERVQRLPVASPAEDQGRDAGEPMPIAGSARQIMDDYRVVPRPRRDCKKSMQRGASSDGRGYERTVYAEAAERRNRSSAAGLGPPGRRGSSGLSRRFSCMV